MGDINKDGYEGEIVVALGGEGNPGCSCYSKDFMFPFSDIAVSAPYEGSGVVYIYHSMEDGGLNLESVQVGQIMSKSKMCLCVCGGGGCWFSDHLLYVCIVHVCAFRELRVMT